MPIDSSCPYCSSKDTELVEYEERFLSDGAYQRWGMQCKSCKKFWKDCQFYDLVGEYRIQQPNEEDSILGD